MKATAKIPVLTVAQMRHWEHLSWEAGIAADFVIQKVGLLAARRVLELTNSGDAIWILAGRGHNGDDARAMAPHLAKREVLHIEVTDPARGLTDFTRQLKSRAPRCIIDGLFGIGLNRPLDSDWRALIEAVNATDRPVVAIDIPSGLDADTGAAEGAAIKAALTLTLAAPKAGLLKAPEFTGRLEVVPDIGLVPCPLRSDLNWTMAADFAGLPPRRTVVANKGNYGHAALFCGSLGYHGACVLPARGAQRERPGLVTAFPQESVYVPVAAQLQSAMIHPWQPAQPLPKTFTALLFGPGLAAKELPETLKEEMRSIGFRQDQLPGDPRGSSRRIQVRPDVCSAVRRRQYRRIASKHCAIYRKSSAPVGWRSRGIRLWWEGPQATFSSTVRAIRLWPKAAVATSWQVI